MEGPLASAVIIIIAGAIIYLTYRYEESKKEAWRTFAAAHNLSFTPGYLLMGSQVSGDYRGHRLELNTYTEDKTTRTRMVLYASHSARGKRALANQAILDRPTSQNLIEFLAPNGLPPLSGRLEVTANGRQLSYKEDGIIQDIRKLERIGDLLSHLSEGYPVIVAVGGEAIPVLQAIATDNSRDNHRMLRRIAVQMLRDIARTTKTRLGHRTERLLCPHCLARCGPRHMRLPWWQSVTYYGCRSCGQSRDFFKGKVVAALDGRMSSERLEREGTLYVNWLIRRELFDFDWVEIAQASDEDAERFAVQVGNDTDSFRKPRYKQMRCILRPGCQLSENTLRILESMFGAVERGQRVVE